ncbi:MAG: transporter substrate-binding protein [Paenibacillus sp.]|nr:transporter substrate-binding protein [Paenibacillus sp.]
MNKRKVLPVVLCSAMALTTLAACGDKDSGDAAGGASGGQGTATKIKVGLTTGALKYVEGSPDINNDKYVKKLEELSKTDLDLQLIPHENYDQSMTLLFAGGELPDLLQTKGINRPEVAPAIEASVLQPLDELIEKYGPNLKKKIPKESWDSARVSKDGKIYGIPQENPILNGTVTYIRKDWLDKLNLQVPKTIDEYIEVMKAFRDNDPNGNGKQDEIALSGRAKLAFAYQFFAAYGVHPQTWTYENNQLVPNFIRPGMVDALKVYRQLYQEKLLDNEVFTQQGKDWDAKIKGQGIVGIWATSATSPDAVEASVKANVPAANLAVIPSPVGPSGQPGGVYPLGSTVSDFVWTIPAKTKNPENIIKFLDWYYSDDKAKDTFFLYGMENDNYTNENGTIQYKYPTTNEQIGAESMYQEWLHFTGGKPHQTNESFTKNKPNGDKIFKSIQVAKAEGVKDDGLEMPSMPTLKARPELNYDGLWLEFAAKVITGKEPVDKFNDFVADWKKRGGDQLIKETTEWYKANQKK